MELVLQTLQQHSLLANLKKCEFGKKKITYLGYVISHEEVAADNRKVQAMTKWAIPRNIKEL